VQDIWNYGTVVAGRYNITYCPTHFNKRIINPTNATIRGCMNTTALNFNALATVNAACLFANASLGCTYPMVRRSRVALACSRAASTLVRRYLLSCACSTDCRRQISIRPSASTTAAAGFLLVMFSAAEARLR